MKKLFTLFLASCLLLSLSACSGVTNDNTGGSATQSQANTTKTDTTVPDASTTGSTEDVNHTTTPDPSGSTPTETSQTTETNQTTGTKDTEPDTSAHTHSYSKATCTAPAKCSCGAIRSKALGHSWKSASCTAPKQCSRCGVTSGKALGHDFPATGWSMSCSRCGALDPCITKPDSIHDLFDDEEPVRLYVTKTIYVYSAPGTEYEVIGTLNKGDMVTRTSKGSLVGWNRIDYNGQRGYVASSCLSTKDPFYIVAEVHGFKVGDTISVDEDLILTYVGEDRWEGSDGSVWTSYEREDGTIHWSSFF